jgi:hypothetical protein
VLFESWARAAGVARDTTSSWFGHPATG